MKVWSSPPDLIAELRKHWERGSILAELVGVPTIFPYRFRLIRPKPGDLLERYDEVRSWTRALVDADGFRVESSIQGARSVGRNEVPSEVWVDSLGDAAVLLNEAGAVAAFQQVVDETTVRLPALLEWLSAHAIEALGVAHDWPRLLDVVIWIQANPRPDIYIRQVNITGVHTKFIERNRKLLSSMLDVVLPAEAFTEEHLPSTAFDRRYGFRVSPPPISAVLLVMVALVMTTLSAGS